MLLEAMLELVDLFPEKVRIYIRLFIVVAVVIRCVHSQRSEQEACAKPDRRRTKPSGRSQTPNDP
jgi:hypothetical protein